MEETMKALEKEKKELQEKFDEFDDKEKAKFNNDFLLYKDYMINKSFHEQGG
jgi:chromosome segregation ATPase